MKPPVAGNGDDWEMVYYCFTHIDIDIDTYGYEYLKYHIHIYIYLDIPIHLDNSQDQVIMESNEKYWT